jgi:hypothetical protein
MTQKFKHELQWTYMIQCTSNTQAQTQTQNWTIDNRT